VPALTTPPAWAGAPYQAASEVTRPATFGHREEALTVAVADVLLLTVADGGALAVTLPLTETEA
jgi:hypothetical protein